MTNIIAIATFGRTALLHQRYKNIAFWVIGKATVPNYFVRRSFSKVGLVRGPRHLHLGSGEKYLSGFVNIDGNPFNRLDLWLDIRTGIPFPAESVDSIYSTHVFEHFYGDELQRLLRECFRVLKPGAGVRLVVPSLTNAITAYNQKRTDWFSNFPQTFESLGGRFSNFVFCDGQHRAAFDFSYLSEVLRGAGFRDVEESGEGKSQLYGDRVPPYEPGDTKDLAHSLYVEAFK
jgi:SAM-dependent methyltransferase